MNLSKIKSERTFESIIFTFQQITAAHCLQAAIVISGVVGQVLVIRKSIFGFYVWMVSNVLLLIASFISGFWGMVILYAFYFLMCIWGVHEWRKNKN